MKNLASQILPNDMLNLFAFLNPILKFHSYDLLQKFRKPSRSLLQINMQINDFLTN